MQLSDSSPSSGVVELREDAPLKAGAGAGGGCGGPRLIGACFAALAAAVTVALLTQIYYGDYQVVPHGSVAAGAEACSAAGTGALKAGGRAADAAAAAALCLALLAPHRTSLDASGALVYWEYRSERAAGPQLLEWGGPGAAGAAGPGAPPRLLVALAALHAEHGALPWRRVLQPTIDLARGGFIVSKALAAAAAGAGAGAGWAADEPRSDTALADYLTALQRNSSAELSASWSSSSAALRRQAAPAAAAGRWTLYAGGAGAAAAARALQAALQPPPADADAAQRRVVKALLAEAQLGSWSVSGVASGLAVIDPFDTYLALVTGLSVPFGSLPGWGAGGAAGARDVPGAPLDLAPAVLLDEQVCGTRYVLGAESSAALAQVAASLAAGAGAEPGAGGVELPRVGVLAGGALALEGALPPALAALAPPPAAVNATPPFPAVNVVQQRGDTLASHADSRGGGIASRF